LPKTSKQQTVTEPVHEISPEERRNYTRRKRLGEKLGLSREWKTPWDRLTAGL